MLTLKHVLLKQSMVPYSTNNVRTPWPKFASELYRPNDRRLSVKWVSTFAVRKCHVVSVMNSYSRILDFLDWSLYFFFQVALQLYSRGWVDPVPYPLLLRKSGSAESNPDLRIFSQVLWPLGHRGGHSNLSLMIFSTVYTNRETDRSNY
jgi:hypothetical protein